MGFPIRKSADQSLFSAPHSLSQSTTSFIASYRQGIHQTPFLRLIRSRRQTTRLLRGTPPGSLVPPSVRTHSGHAPHGIAPAHARVSTVSVRLGDPQRSPAVRRRRIRTRIHTLSLHDVKPDGCLKGIQKVQTNICPGRTNRGDRKMVEPVGLEPTTLCLQSRCSPS